MHTIYTITLPHNSGFVKYQQCFFTKKEQAFRLLPYASIEFLAGLFLSLDRHDQKRNQTNGSHGSHPDADIYGALETVKGCPGNHINFSRAPPLMVKADFTDLVYYLIAKVAAHQKIQ